MIIRSFLQWTATAPSDARAEGAASLARAYVEGELDEEERLDAEAVMTALLDDGSPAVRLAMAEVLSPSPLTPHALITALTADRSDIAALAFEFSPLLTTPELVDAAAVGDAIVQAAIARRQGLDIGLSAALGEVGALPACIALCRNTTAVIGAAALARMIQRFGDDGELRAAVGMRSDLAPGLRCDLVTHAAQSLGAFVTACGWLSSERAGRLTRDAAEQACVTIAAEAFDVGGARHVAQLTRHLRATGALTAALILRAVLCGNMALFETALSELSGVPVRRVAGLIAHGPGLGFTALYRKSGLPAALRPAFEAAVQHTRGMAPDGTTLQRGRIGRVIRACSGSRDGELATVMTLLRRLDAEAARNEARAFARDVMIDPTMLRLPRLAAEDRRLPLPSAA